MILSRINQPLVDLLLVTALRSPKSGSRPKPIKLNNLNFAWQSVALAGRFLDIDRKTVRNKIGIEFEYLTPNEFENWAGSPNKKITVRFSQKSGVSKKLCFFDRYKCRFFYKRKRINH